MTGNLKIYFLINKEVIANNLISICKIARFQSQSHE
jgi:hypothetical protein